MPTYQYACKETACGHRFEAVQSFSDDPIATCPICEGQVRKIFSAVGVVFKGSGFYRTDSREAAKASNGSSPKGAGEKTSESAASSSSDSSSSGSSAGSASKTSASSSSSSGSTSKAAAS